MRNRKLKNIYKKLKNYNKNRLFFSRFFENIGTMVNPFTRRAIFYLGIFVVVCAAYILAQVIYPIDKIYWESRSTATKFTIQTNKAVRYKDSGVARAKNLTYFYVDLYDTQVDYDKRLLEVKDGIVNAVQVINYNLPDLKVVRFVFYLENTASYNISKFYNPFRYVITIGSLEEEEGTPITTPYKSRIKPIQGIPGSKKKVVIIDPGHGGNSTGAKSYQYVDGRYIYEKEILLDYAIELYNKINSSPNMIAYLTRDCDKYVSLEERINYSERHKGDLFISLHLNASATKYDNSRVRGVEIYCLNPQKLQSESNRFLERLENDEDLKITLPQNSNVNLKNLLLTLVKENLEKWQGKSSSLANSIIDSLTQYSYYRYNNRGIKNAGFKVLRNHYMPAVLLEIAFITNAKDLSFLIDQSFQHQTIDAIYNGIQNYFQTVE